MNIGFTFFFYSLIFCSEDELTQNNGHSHQEWQKLERTTAPEIFAVAVEGVKWARKNPNFDYLSAGMELIKIKNNKLLHAYLVRLADSYDNYKERA